eukprot:gene2159-17749_t
MEVACAKNLLSRSVQKCRYRYTTMLCDGDSKAFSAVRKPTPYGPDIKIEKEDCINHVSKRMGSALRNLVAESKAQKASFWKRKTNSRKDAKDSKLLLAGNDREKSDIWRLPLLGGSIRYQKEVVVIGRRDSLSEGVCY